VLGALAFNALNSAPGEEDVAFLASLLNGSSQGLARRALRGLGRAPGGSQPIAEYLSSHAGDLDPSLSRELDEALARSGLAAGDTDLIESLLTEGSPNTIASTLGSLARSDHPALSQQGLEQVAHLAGYGKNDSATPFGDSVRSHAIQALSASGQDGMDRLWAIVRSDEFPLLTRLAALDSVANDAPAPAADAALQLLPEAEVAQEAVDAAKIALYHGRGEAEVAAALREWIKTRPAQEAALYDELLGRNRRGLISLAEVLFADRSDPW
jgi:hypothetical protein